MGRRLAIPKRHLRGPCLVAVIAAVVALVRSRLQKKAEKLFYSEERAAKALSRDPPHLHPNARGKQGSYSWVQEFTGPWELSERTLAWKWTPVWGRWWSLSYGTVIDHEGNIYLSSADAVRKFSPQGTILWQHSTLPHRSSQVYQLWRGGLYGTTTDGSVRALDIENGDLLWRTKVSIGISEDNGMISVSDGLVVICSDPPVGKLEFSSKVKAMNASDGDLVWEFLPDNPVWNFMASMPGDGTTVFQDMIGRAYRLNLYTGELIWKAGGHLGSWTDGTATLGPDNVVYVVGCRLWQGQGGEWAPGTLWAYNLDDGRLLWQVETHRPPNVAPAVGKLYKKDTFSVVQASGQQVNQGFGTDVDVYDAKTGALQWHFDGPAQIGKFQAGDWEGAEIRNAYTGRGMCLPNPWGAPVIDAAGTVYIGNQDGIFYGLRDVNGDGKVEGPDEVSAYATNGTFAGSAGPSLAPGRVVVANCDSMYVYDVSSKAGETS